MDGRITESRIETRLRLEDFFSLEADLLDEGEFSEWLQLLHPEISYRVLMSRNVHSTERTFGVLGGPLDVAWVDEGFETIRQRVEQFATGIHWAEEPVSRTSHLITNVRLLSTETTHHGATHTVKMRFLVHRNRGRSNEDTIIGKRVDRVVDEGDALRIISRIVTLDQTVLLANNLTTFL